MVELFLSISCIHLFNIDYSDAIGYNKTKPDYKPEP
jgi:hypothetical protein